MLINPSLLLDRTETSRQNVPLQLAYTYTPCIVSVAVPGNTCTRCNATVGRKIILDRLEIARGKGSIIRGIERKASIFEGNDPR